MANTINPKKPYTAPGVVIGEEYSPGSPVVNPQSRVVTYIGRGSRLMRSTNQGMTRGFIYDKQLSFSLKAPHVAALSPASNGYLKNAVLATSSGTEVRSDLWMLSSDYTSIQLADSAFDANETYFFSYQSNDRGVGDPIPTADLRLIESVGSQMSQDTYKRNADYYVDTVINAPEAAVTAEGSVVQHTNSAPSFTSVEHVGSGTAVVALSTSSLFTHNYSRGYKLVVKHVAGTTITFAWHSTPLEFGNDSAPAIPLAAGVAAPEFSIETTNPQTLTVDLEFGVRIDFGTGTYVVNDTFSFNALGPALIERQSAYTNTNQFASVSDVVAGSNAGTGSLVVDATSYALESNTKFVAQVTGVDTGVVIAQVPEASMLFGDNPVAGNSFVLTNGFTGASRVSKPFEFSTGAQSIPGSALITLASTTATAATGTISFLGSATQAPRDGDKITITAEGKTVVFEFDADNSLSAASNVRVIIDQTVGQQSAKSFANLATAINANAIGVSAVDASASNFGIGLVNLTVNSTGIAGNNSIVSSNPTLIRAVGFAGGTDAMSDVQTTIDTTIFEINNSVPRLGIVAYRDTNQNELVRMTYGTRLDFVSNPVVGDTFTFSVGEEAYVFEIGSSVGIGHIPVAVGNNTDTTLSNLAAAVFESDNNLVAASSVVGSKTLTVASSIGRSVAASYTGTSVSLVTADVVTAGSSSAGNAVINATLANVEVEGFAGGKRAGDAPDIVTFAWGTAGDVFASGTVTISESTADQSLIPLYAGVKIRTSKPLASKATGSVTLHAVPVNNDTITIDDKINALAVFTFKTSPVGPNDIGIVSGNIAANVSAVVSAIRSSGLSVSASATGNSVSVTHTRTGSAYNSGLSVSGANLTCVNLTGGGTNYVIGDKFEFTALAPRKFTTALDTRTTTLTVAGVGLNSAALVDPSYVSFGYASSTPEGGFGTLETFGGEHNKFVLPGQIALVVRNPGRMVSGDVFSVSYVNNGFVYWDLDKYSTETLTTAEVLRDRNGTITGVPGAFYIILRQTPYAGSITMKANGSVFNSFTLVAGTSIVILGIASASEITTLIVTYRNPGSEPALGSTWYLSGQYLRPKSWYNKPVVFYDRTTARAWLDPVTTNNDLAIMNEIAWAQAPAPVAVAFVQILDSDDDNVFSPSDIDAAITGLYGVRYATDVLGVNLPQYQDKLIAYNINACDPFEARKHFMYFGLPIGTSIGSELEEGTTIYTARRTLQVYGNSPAHGTRILVGSTYATWPLTTYDGSTASVTVDGSFIAGAIAALIGGQPDNATSLLRKNLLGFTSMETFSDTGNMLLGAASVLYFQPNGTNTFQIMECVTVDDTDEKHHEILACKTKQDSERDMRVRLDKTLIGFVPDTKAGGIGFIKAGIVSGLMAQVGSGLIAPFQDESGNVRQPSTNDVQVIRDKSKATRYRFRYLINTRSTIKDLWGTYETDEATLTGTLS